MQNDTVGGVLRSIGKASTARAFPAYIASEIARAFRYGQVPDQEKIIRTVAPMVPGADGRHEVTMTDFNGHTYRVTVEVVR